MSLLLLTYLQYDNSVTVRDIFYEGNFSNAISKYFFNQLLLGEVYLIPMKRLSRAAPTASVIIVERGFLLVFAKAII
jgi:hypothetical protein